MNGCAKSPIYRENAHNEWRFVSRFDWGRIDSVICIFAVWEIQERIKSKQNNKNKKEMNRFITFGDRCGSGTSESHSELKSSLDASP